MNYGSKVGASDHFPELQMLDKYNRQVSTVDSIEIPGSVRAAVRSRLFLWSIDKPRKSVLTWSSYIEYDGSRYVRLLQRIWISLEPIPIETTSSEQKTQGCIMRAVVRSTPVDTDLDTEKVSHIEEMAEVVIGTYERGQDQLAALSLAS